MADVRLSRLAVEDLDALIVSHGLPADTRPRIARSLRPLESFPLLGGELEGHWQGMRFLIGPWPWMLIVYAYAEDPDVVTVLSIHDGRMSTSATAG